MRSMNMLTESLRQNLRCPRCKSDRLAFGEQEPWASCEDCGEKFGAVDGIPFLATPEIVAAVSDAQSVRLNETHHDQLDGETVKKANVAFHNKFAEDYEHDVSTYDMFVADGACQRRIQTTLQQAATTSGSETLLDVCCGTGNILRTAGKIFDQSLGLDISVNMMNIAKGRDLTVLGADALNLPLGDGRVNCVTAFSALHHIVDYPVVAAEMARTLKPGGTFYSDWDPNGHVTHTGWVVSVAVWAVKKARSVLTQSQIPETPEQQAAEYHHFSKHGFDAEKVATALRAAGCDPVDIIYHANPGSLEQAQGFNIKKFLMGILKILSFIAPSPKNINPWVAIRAVKKI